MSHGSQDKIRASDKIEVSFEEIIMILDAMDHIFYL
jgi:hypothetical protein